LWDFGPDFIEEIVEVDGITVGARDLAPANAAARFIRLRVTRSP
jgi:hypothetical protein